MSAILLGQGYYGRQSAMFDVRVPAWRRNARGELVRTTVPLADQWLRLAPGGRQALDALQQSIYGADPDTTRRRVAEALIQATRSQATSRQTVRAEGPQPDPFTFGEGGGCPLPRRTWPTSSFIRMKSTSMLTT